MAPGNRRHFLFNNFCSGRSRASVFAMLTESSLRLERYMDLVSFRQKLTASNIANADTPGYKTQDIDFQSALATATGQQPAIIDAAGLTTKNDGNNVNVDRESRLLSENAIRFTIASNLLQGQIRTLRSAIQEGRS
jgi:flagellar basal-body rod protein FlgB